MENYITIDQILNAAGISENGRLCSQDSNSNNMTLPHIKAVYESQELQLKQQVQDLLNHSPP